MKIGILLTRAKSEKKKDELVNINSNKRPWLREIYYSNPEFYKQFSVISSKGKLSVPGDVSIGMYISWNWKNTEIDYILPQDISVNRLHSNDINFMIIYDLIESFHVDSPKIYRKLENTLKQCKNIYPPYDYQKFINNKCNYITHLERKKDAIIPTKCIMTDYFKKHGLSKCMDMLENHISKYKWDKFIGKPVFGQESIDFKKFDKFTESKVSKYMKAGFKKYPGLIFQKYIDGFDKSNPEVRFYFFGNKFKYSVITTDTTVKIPKEELGTEKIPTRNALIKKAKITLSNLPPIIMKGKKMPRLLTRIDVACQKKYAKPWLVNEVEFVPSLYIQDINYIPEILMGDQMIKITKAFKYATRNLKTK
jgi:hypothetical protein